MTEKKNKTMPPDSGTSLRRLNRFGLFVLAAVLLLGVCLDASVVVSSADPVVSNSTVSLLQLSSQLVKTNYSEIVSDPSLNTSTIILNGALKNMVQLPAESLVVRLPDDRLAIKSSTETSILPEGSTVVYYDEKPVVRIPQQSDVLAVSSVVVSPLQNFTMKTNFIQSIPELDVYQVQVVFFELAREHLDVPLASYTIDWGDGSTETYSADRIAVAHDYQRSGTYRLIFNVSDSLGFTYVTTQSYTVAYEGNLVHSSLWVNKNKGPISMFSLSFGLLAVGLAVFTETGRYRLLVLFTLLLPFYSRMAERGCPGSVRPWADLRVHQDEPGGAL